MTDPKGPTNDEAFDSLIEQLGLDLDISAEFSGAETAGEEFDADSDDTPMFQIRDADAAPPVKRGPDGEIDTGVELSADLMAELQSVIGAGASAMVAVEDGEDDGADVFAPKAAKASPEAEPDLADFVEQKEDEDFDQPADLAPPGSATSESASDAFGEDADWEASPIPAAVSASDDSDPVRAAISNHVDELVDQLDLGAPLADDEALDDFDFEADLQNKGRPSFRSSDSAGMSGTAPLAASSAMEADAPPFSDSDDGGFDVGFSFGDSAGGDRMVPRIAVHAFATTASTTRLLTESKNDRRMANVSMEIHQGGVETAIDYYAARANPHLMIVECTESAGRVLTELDRLAECCDENVKVVVIGAANDIRLYRELMSRGVSEYLVPPIETVQLIRAIAALFVDPDQPFIGKTITVTGVKGGVGASVVAHNLAWSVSERLMSNATLVDLDLNFGTTGLDFNEEGAQTIADALLSPDRFDENVLERLLTKATDRLSLFTAPATLDRTYDFDTEVYERVINQVRQSVPFVILDTPHIWSDWFKTTLISSDEIIVVTQPDLACLRNGKNLIDFLKAARPNDAPPRLVMNSVGVPKRPEIPVKDFAQAMGVEPDLVLPFDPQLFGTASNNGQMIRDVSPESKCAQGIDYLASVVTGQEIKSTEKTSLLNKLFKM